ncbi:MAG: hypothetical protein RLZZ187_2595 [Pseudomonadota bacterium]|jgi:phage repressor protein C with HTH and peptisase S24 domain
MDDVRQRLAELLKAQDRSLAAASRAIGRNPAYLQQFIERGVPRALPEDVREDLAALIGCTPDELRSLPGRKSPRTEQAKHTAEAAAHPNAVPAPDVEPPAPRPSGPPDVPLFGAASCGADGSFAVNMIGGAVDYIPRPGRLLNAKNLFAVIAQGDSMEPLYQHGMTVFCREGFPIRENDPVLVELEQGPGAAPLAFLKVYISLDDRQLRLRQLTPPTTIEFDRVRLLRIWRALRPQEAL